MRVRVLGVSRVLAVWRCLIYARKVGVYLRNQGEAQSQTPTFYSRTSGCPRGGGHMVGVLSALGRNTPPTYASIHLPGALPLEPAICLVRLRDGGRAVANAPCGNWIQPGWGRGVADRKRFRPPGPMPGVLEEDAAGAVIIMT